MKTIINPDQERIQNDEWFRGRGRMRANPGHLRIRAHHARFAPPGSVHRCRRCYAYTRKMSFILASHEIDGIHMFLNQMRHLLDADWHRCWVEAREDAAGFWHVVDGTDEMIFTPYPHLSAHEVLEALEAAEADPSFGCRGFDAPAAEPGGPRGEEP